MPPNTTALTTTFASATTRLAPAHGMPAPRAPRPSLTSSFVVLRVGAVPQLRSTEPAALAEHRGLVQVRVQAGPLLARDLGSRRGAPQLQVPAVARPRNHLYRHGKVASLW